MPVSRTSTLPNSSPVASRSVGFCEGVRTRCNPSAPTPSRGVPASSASVDSASSLRTRAIIGGECTIEAHAMSALRPWFLWLLLLVAAAAVAGEALKGKALLLFRRSFTDRRRPADGDVLDREGQMPQSYAAERAPTVFERELWARFWELANDPEEARRHGVRALHGEAVSTRLRKERVYTITLRSTGELTIQPTQ